MYREWIKNTFPKKELYMNLETKAERQTYKQLAR
jgi:hypothetical protein